jgi:hypothetical protein
MPGWLKALFAIAIIVVLLVGAVVVGGVVWLSRNKERLMGRAKEVMTEGRDFGRNTDNQGCMDETVSRYKKEPGFSNAISTTIFTRACLDASRPTPGFCDDVPQPTEFIKSGQWTKEQCSRVGLSSDRYCQQVFQPEQAFCAKGTRKSADSNSQ